MWDDHLYKWLKRNIRMFALLPLVLYQRQYTYNWRKHGLVFEMYWEIKYRDMLKMGLYLCLRHFKKKRWNMECRWNVGADQQRKHDSSNIRFRGSTRKCSHCRIVKIITIIKTKEGAVVVLWPAVLSSPNAIRYLATRGQCHIIYCPLICVQAHVLWCACVYVCACAWERVKRHITPHNVLSLCRSTALTNNY